MMRSALSVDREGVYRNITWMKASLEGEWCVAGDSLEVSVCVRMYVCVWAVVCVCVCVCVCVMLIVSSILVHAHAPAHTDRCTVLTE